MFRRFVPHAVAAFAGESLLYLLNLVETTTSCAPQPLESANSMRYQLIPKSEYPLIDP
jgi:hypothetical protein